jgi:arsenical pump membrane protein
VTTARRGAALLRRLPALDWIRIGLLVAGLLAVSTGLLPAAEAEQSLRRIAPLLLFIAGVIVLATLTNKAQVFDTIATRLAIVGRGSYLALFLLCVAFASATTIFLNLDTTAVLLTPVFLALARRASIADLPLAMTTIWLANTASMLLPVSNLTNLLAAGRVALTAPEFATRMWAPQLAILAATMVFLWVFYWRHGRRGADRYVPAPPVRFEGSRQRTLFRVAAASCLLFIGAIPFVGEHIGYAAAAAALVLVIAFAVLDRTALRLSLVPWRLLIFVTGLFLVVPTLSIHGLTDVMAAVIGPDPGAEGAFRAAAAGAGLSNLVNNLPAYAAGETAVPLGNHDQLLALLIGTNAGPIITPWASLATLLCLESCRAAGLRINVRRFALHGFGLAVVTVGVGVLVLLLSA